MAYSLNGFNNKVATFEADINVQDGELITITNEGKVAPARENDDIIGLCVSRNNVCAGVLLEGYVELGYTGTAPTTGYKNLVVTGKATVGVKDSPVAGKKRLIVKVDSTNKKIGFIL